MRRAGTMYRVKRNATIVLGAGGMSGWVWNAAVMDALMRHEAIAHQPDGVIIGTSAANGDATGSKT